MWPRSSVSASLAILAAIGCARPTAQRPIDAPQATHAAPASSANGVPGAGSGPRIDSGSSPPAVAQIAAAARDGDEPITPGHSGPGSLFAFELETLPPARPAGAIAASTFDEELARWNLGGNGDPAHPSNRERYHPAARVVVDAISVSRRLPQKARGDLLTSTKLVAQARSSGYWPFRLCLEAGLRRDPELGGITKVRITLGRRGRVLHARLMNTELRERAIAACVVRAARQLRFSAPPRALDADLSVQLWPGDAPLPAVGDPGSAVRADSAALASHWEEELAAAARCFAAGLERDPALWGRIALRVRWSSSGAVSSVEEHGTRFPDPAVTRCMLDALQRARPPLQSSFPELVLAVRAGTPPPSPTERGPENERRTDSPSPAPARDALHSSPCATCPSPSSSSP